MMGGMLAPGAMKIGTPAGDLSELIRAVAGGDADALADLFHQVESPVYAFALSRLGDREQAADVLHEVMLEVWRRAVSFEGRSRALTWILGIAHHKVSDALRRRRRWRPEPPPGEDVEDPAAPSPPERLERRERREVVERALAALSDAHRQVVHLAFYQDLSYPEISRLLGIPVGTVKTRMFHAKKALQQRLARPLEGGEP